MTSLMEPTEIIGANIDSVGVKKMLRGYPLVKGVRERGGVCVLLGALN